jgi:hypothetical protein
VDVWGLYTKESRDLAGNATGTDDVLLQADPVNRARYERKGFTFKEYAPAPGVGPAIQACTVPTAAEQVLGFVQTNGQSDLDDNEIVKQAAEVALRKMTGTYTQAEAVAEEAAHAMGEYKPPETPFAIVQGDVLEGYDALSANGPLAGTPSSGPGAPVAQSTGPAPGEAGTGTPAPQPEPAPVGAAEPPAEPPPSEPVV